MSNLSATNVARVPRARGERVEARQSLPTENDRTDKRCYSVGILLCDGFNSFDLSAIVDTLRIAEERAFDRHFEIQLLGHPARAVRSSSGFEVVVDEAAETLSDQDHVFILAGDIGADRASLAAFERYCAGSKAITLVSAELGLCPNARSWLGKLVSCQKLMQPGIPISPNRVTHSYGYESILVEALALITSILGRPLALKTADALNCERLISLDALRLHDLGRGLMSAPPALNHAVRNMLSAPSERRSFNAIALDAQISLRQLERLFRRYLDISPRDFRKLCRLHCAQHAITTTEKPILEIAKESGFASESHFSREFKRFFKKGPRAFRAQESNPRAYISPGAVTVSARRRGAWLPPARLVNSHC